MLSFADRPAAVQRFSLDSAPTEQRGQFFQRQMHEMCSVSLAVRSSHQHPLAAQVTAYCGRNLRFASLRFSPHSTLSVPGVQSDDSRLLVSLHKEGRAVVAQGDRECRVEPGDIFVIDPSRPFSIEAGEIHVHSVYLRRCAVRAIFPDLDVLTAVPLRTCEAAGALLRAAIEGLTTFKPPLHDDVADRIADALPYLLAPALSAVNVRHNCIPSRLKLLHKQRIRRFVREHLSDAGLGANTIARAVQLSPRHLYELFADEPEPLMKWVWAERLERTRSDLAQPSLKAQTIGQIAYSWGFNDVSHFSRSFKLRFGCSPRDYRAHASQGSLELVRHTDGHSNRI